ncbi:MAG TPA: glutathione S-transferase family protein [Myxococcota bacterium]
MSVTLYFAPFTRATRPRWLLEELGVAYDLVVVDKADDGHFGDAAFRAGVHPLGKLPALSIDGVTMFESAAIIALLADRHLDKGLAPALDATERAPYLQWLFYAMTTVEPAVVSAAGHKDDAEALAKSKARFAEAVAPVARLLATQDWLLTTGFSAADVVMGAVLIWAASIKLVDDTALLAYVERCKARPLWKKTLR